jgi:chromosome segregation ATPase
MSQTAAPLTAERIKGITDIANARQLCLGLFSQREKLLAQRSELRGTVDDLRARLQFQQLELDGNIAKSASMQEMIRGLLADKDAVDRANHDLKEQLATIEVELSALKSTSTTSSNDAVLDLQSKLTAAFSEKREAENRLNDLRLANAALEAAKDAIAAENSSMESELVTLKQTIARLNLTAESLKSLQCVVAERDELAEVSKLSQIQELDSKNGALGLEDVVRLRTANAELEEKNQGLESALQVRNREISELKSRQQKLFEHIEELSQKSDQDKNESSKQITDLESQLVRAQEEAASLRNSQKELDAQPMELRGKLLSSQEQQSQSSSSELSTNQLKESKKQIDMLLRKLADSEASVSHLKQQLQDFVAMKKKVTNLESVVASLKSKEADLNRQISELLPKSSEFESVKVSRDALAKENATMKVRLQELSEYYEHKENEPRNSDLQSLIHEKDRTIEKLKKLVQRTRKEDERKQQQINDLQSERQTRMTLLPAHATPDLLETIDRLETHARDLEQRLQANKEMEQKNEQLTKMLDKSNRLYATLLEQNQTLIAEQSRTEPKPLTVSKLVQFSIQPDLRATLSRSLPRLGKDKGKPDEKKITDTYLKRVLLQFFFQDDTTRDQLIPLILELVGCSDQHILAAQRQWQRSIHATPKSSGFFGL